MMISNFACVLSIAATVDGSVMTLNGEVRRLGVTSAFGGGCVKARATRCIAGRRAYSVAKAASSAVRNSLGGLRIGVAAFVCVAALVFMRRRLSNAAPIKKFIARNTAIKIIDGGRSVDDKDESRQDEICWYIKDDAVIRRIFSGGHNLALGETYVEGLWDSNDIRKLVLELIKLERVKMQLGLHALPIFFGEVIGKMLAMCLPSNTLSSSRKNITYHYDVSDKMFQRQLGPTMQYTCAYFHRPKMSLDEAQLAKMRTIAHKLDLRPGMRVVELGCGYGALAYLLATEFGVHVTGVSLSHDQVAYAKQHFAHPRVEISLQDYRNLEGVYDRVYSVGIFEHIGRKNYKTYFDKCYDLLAPDGIMLIHTIGWGVSGRWNPNTFMFKHIFPGAEIPHASHMTNKYTDRWHLEDWHNFGKSYSPTAQQWYANLEGSDEFEAMDERFQRMWRYYLLGGAAAFDSRRCSLWQLVFTKALSSRDSDCHHIRAKQRERPARPRRAGLQESLIKDSLDQNRLSQTRAQPAYMDRNA
eukprot:TRINITY_DN33212_c0_g1_i1.p1 TRINITY_DN33212_c0_g1~~TRINITY_DN33212_c0_g1_i1.p1  ORF type:complete len:527 (+),score=59.38 TRINITY_DN33212_c0_g1_i1:77-1657(+)